METRPLRLPVQLHGKAIAYCQSLLNGPDPAPKADPSPQNSVTQKKQLTLRQIKDLEEVREIYGAQVADRLMADMLGDPDPAPKADPAPQNSVTQNLGLAELDPRSILADPKRFQFKLIHNAKTGSSGSLKGVSQWNHDLSGLLLVWRDPQNNQVYVVNGHNRLDLAIRLGVDRIAVRFINASDHVQARMIGAIANISEGKGSPLDVATLIRDLSLSKDDLADLGVKITDALADKGIAIANLESAFFNMVLEGRLSDNEAIAMGRLDKSMQSAFYELIRKDKRKLTNEVLDQLADIVKSSVSAQSFELNLFGENSVTQNLAIYKAEIDAYILKRLKRDKRLFSFVSKTANANDLQRGNNAIDTLTSSNIADKARAAIDIFNQLKNQSGSLCKKLNDAAIALHNGDNGTQVKQDIYDWVLSELNADNLLSLAI
ncbi:hypothetical protein AWQ21_09560 [Picosynechococcus sp. PCC 7003]|nr:hypothetical protein AWQ21_09560 [Picosynechococcus sp. PCC 7003]